MSSSYLWLIASLTSVSMSCAPMGRTANSGKGDLGAGPLCGAYNQLTDLHVSLQVQPLFAASSKISAVIAADEELGHLRNAKRRLESHRSSESQDLSRKLTQLDEALKARRQRLQELVEALQESYAAAESALDEAAVCEGVDLRGPSETPTLDQRKEADAKREADRKKIRSDVCQPTLRLWATASNVNLTEHVSVSSGAAQVMHLTLDEKRGEIRDRLANALRRHGENLQAYQDVANPKATDLDDDTRALISLRSEAIKDLQSARQGCLETMKPSGRVVGGKPTPRRGTVVVRPVWSGAMESLARGMDSPFGSGFVVRWRNGSGELETRIVTNTHVMAGAYEARIVPGDGLASKSSDSKEEGWRAVLVRADPNTDVAILRLEQNPASGLEEGLTFRLHPAQEQEKVVAAGFPGVGIRPSFQVSEGSVSNARFGADEMDGDYASAFVQHTAPIDPGNSGGPLLDSRGRLLGMNTLKIIGRENVGLAIPTARIQQAILEADQPVVFDVKHAEASCNAVLGALSSDMHLEFTMSRFGLPLFEAAEGEPVSPRAVALRDRVQRRWGLPTEEARIRAFAMIRAQIEEEQGVRPFETCSQVQPVASTPGSFTASIRTRQSEHQLTFAEEQGTLRLIRVQ